MVSCFLCWRQRWLFSFFIRICKKSQHAPNFVVSRCVVRSSYITKVNRIHFIGNKIKKVREKKLCTTVAGWTSGGAERMDGIICYFSNPLHPLHLLVLFEFLAPTSAKRSSVRNVYTTIKNTSHKAHAATIASS